MNGCDSQYLLLRPQNIRKNPLAMAAPVLAYEDLSLVQGSGWLFRDLNIHIQERDRLQLSGRLG